MIKPIIRYDDFAKLDLRIGKVLSVRDVPGSEKLYKMTVDLGTQYGKRTILAGVKQWYKKAQLAGKNFIVIANLAPRTIMGVESQGMMLAIDGEKPLLIPVGKVAKPGASLC